MSRPFMACMNLGNCQKELSTYTLERVLCLDWFFFRRARPLVKSSNMFVAKAKVDLGFFH